MFLFGMWSLLLGIGLGLLAFKQADFSMWILLIGAVNMIASVIILPNAQKRLSELQNIQNLIDKAREAKAAALLAERKAERLLDLVRKNNLEYLE